MTCLLLTPWWRRRTPGAASSDGSVRATRTLDHGSDEVTALVARARAAAGSPEPVMLLRVAHEIVGREVRPVYGVDERRPASRTLRDGRGSCSQRLAVLEAVARATGVPTRARGLLVDGRFWYPRFPRLVRAVPRHVVLAWPELYLDGRWLPVDEVLGADAGVAEPFTNDGPETLFDAVARTRVAWDAPTCLDGACDLTEHVVRELGRYMSRDELFARHGQTLCWVARRLGDPVLRRWSPVTVTAVGGRRPR
ncbi:transglutaminase-like domain-containing protein [Luteimicrobium subarcticum]|uniref:Transglutaminase superfamily protein n=1 Tax=Luteimicrobium subarcticum TaxID=620910 RepID=A0A2M8WSR7_9MICO|nr:transglutaminase-like domain-containing protein [Luteimicrobium subarcticum]PJI93973.1 transglutaminase superfamily protein [Luteimicrobium subarcticum]